MMSDSEPSPFGMARSDDLNGWGADLRGSMSPIEAIVANTTPVSLEAHAELFARCAALEAQNAWLARKATERLQYHSGNGDMPALVGFAASFGPDGLPIFASIMRNGVVREYRPVATVIDPAHPDEFALSPPAEDVRWLNREIPVRAFAIDPALPGADRTVYRAVGAPRLDPALWSFDDGSGALSDAILARHPNDRKGHWTALKRDMMIGAMLVPMDAATLSAVAEWRRRNPGEAVHSLNVTEPTPKSREGTAAHLDTDQPMTFGTFKINLAPPTGKMLTFGDAVQFTGGAGGGSGGVTAVQQPTLTPHHHAMIAAARRLWDATAAFREATGGVWPAAGVWHHDSHLPEHPVRAYAGPTGACIRMSESMIYVANRSGGATFPMPPFFELAALDAAPGIPEALDRARERRGAVLSPFQHAMAAAAERAWRSSAAMQRVVPVWPRDEPTPFYPGARGHFPSAWFPNRPDFINTRSEPHIHVTPSSISIVTHEKPGGVLHEFPMPPFDPAVAPGFYSATIRWSDGSQSDAILPIPASPTAITPPGILADPMDPKDVRGRW